MPTPRRPSAKLGKFPLPIEISRFGCEATRNAIVNAAAECQLSGAVALRKDTAGKAVLTDSGNTLVDCAFGVIPDPEKLAARLSAIPGIVEHGLFIGLADAVIAASGDGIEIFGQLN